MTLAGLALPARALADTIVGGVRIGVQSYSFRELPRTPGGDAWTEANFQTTLRELGKLAFG